MVNLHVIMLQWMFPQVMMQNIPSFEVDGGEQALRFLLLMLLHVVDVGGVDLGVCQGFDSTQTRGCRAIVWVREAPLFSGADLRKHAGVWAGDITSRLAADTTTVSDQITLNLNVAMRSVAQAALVLVFMLRASWRLTVVSLIIIPFELLISKVYGGVYRSAAAPVPAIGLLFNAMDSISAS
jgi:ABC-type multidrug transport system fused ATPase/permease subunit